MSKVILVMGKSAAGKDTVMRSMLDWNYIDLKIRPISRITTRPIREEEIHMEPKPYAFLTENQFQHRIVYGRYMPVEEYNTTEGIWKYSSKIEHVTNRTNINYIATCAPSHLEEYIKTYGADNIVVLYISANPKIRITRSLSRIDMDSTRLSMDEEDKKVEEICRRFISDNRDFSDDTWKLIRSCHHVIYRVNNYHISTNSLYHCIKEAIK